MPGDAVEAAFLRVLEASGDTMTEAQIRSNHKLLKELSQEQFAEVLNSLLVKERLELHQRGNDITFKLVDEVIATRLVAMSHEGKAVYRAILESAGEGITGASLKRKTNLPVSVIQGVIRKLMGQLLVKPLDVAKGPGKRYMSYDLAPAEHVTGGSFYSEFKFDEQFVDGLRQVMLKYFDVEPMGTTDSLHEFIKNSNVCKVEILPKDIQRLLNSLILDRILEIVPAHKVVAEDPSKKRKVEDYYRLRKATASAGGFQAVPCSTCPIIAQCMPGGEVSPETCEYMQTWLDF